MIVTMVLVCQEVSLSFYYLQVYSSFQAMILHCFERCLLVQTRRLSAFETIRN